MKNRIADMSHRTAARVVGIGFLIMFILVIFAEFFVFQNIIVEGDAATTAKNIKANELLFYTALDTYIIIVAIVDAMIALALYIVLKPVHKNLALLQSVFRLLFDAIMVISLIALALGFIDAYFIGKLIAYIFSVSTIFTLGYVVFKSNYIPRSLGVFLIIGSFSYVITIYGHFFIPTELYEPLFMIAMVPAAFAEMSIGIWLLLKADFVEEKNTGNDHI